METIASLSPQNHDDVVIVAPRMTADDVHHAFDRAAVAQKEWWAMGAAGRAAALHAAAEALAARADEATDRVVREVGKPLAEAKGEV